MLFSWSDAIILNAKYKTDARTYIITYYDNVRTTYRITRKLVTSLGKEQVVRCYDVGALVLESSFFIVEAV